MPINKDAKKLTTKQLKCIELMLEGKTQVEIAKEIGVHEGSVSRWKNQDIFRNALREAVNKKFERLAVIAQLQIQYLAENAQSESVRLSAAKDLLDRGGYKPTDKTELTTGEEGFNIIIDYGDNDDANT